MSKINLSYVLALLSFFFFYGCNKEELLTKGDEFITYTIPAGEHRATSNVKILTGNELRFKILFDSSAMYTLQDPVNQYSINKLYGFSDCNSQHHNNSARIGWRWLNNKLELFAYCYVESERSSQLLTTIEIGKEYECVLGASDNNYFFTINGTTCMVKRGCNKTKVKYYLYPYFGGTEPATHDITIKIKRL
ncbi:MAG: hypothetical protein H0V01_06595 [Bacteroidetes bacterium]|nr:hypothetical protein [Bacteroidota bacterium]HET6245157.1 hypothetical protein [Bacteroidia bacterium]